MMLHKRAVSPLIATVLLVMIVVSIGAAVMVVIQGLTDESLESTERFGQLIKCAADVEVELIKSANDAEMICITPANSTNETGTISLYIENSGLRNIAGWRLTVIGNGGIYDSTDQCQALDRGQIKLFQFTYDRNDTGTGLTNITRLRISPRLPSGNANEIVTCSEPNFEWDYDDLADWYTCDEVTWDSASNNC